MKPYIDIYTENVLMNPPYIDFYTENALMKPPYMISIERMYL